MKELQNPFRKQTKNFILHLPGYQTIIDTGLQQLKDEKIVHRIWQHDHTVWKSDPTEISNRLGWLHSPKVMREFVGEIQQFVGDVKKEGFTQAILLGMGGSSLAALVMRSIFPMKSEYLDLQVLDSTHPKAILNIEKELKQQKTLFIVSTKSGGTAETLSFMRYFYNQTMKKVGKQKVGSHFVAITDPGSKLESPARQLGFRKVFLNDSDIGGRYSALSYFGLVPAGLMGIDLKQLLDRAEFLAANSKDEDLLQQKRNTAAILGTVIGKLAQQGRDKLTFITSPQIKSFGMWVEQLIAESTGKQGTGILPVVNETILESEVYGDDRLFVFLKLNEETTNDQKVKSLQQARYPVIQINLKDIYDCGAEFFRWEMATAVAGYFLHINPFDQPNVEATKKLTKEMVKTFKNTGKLPKTEPAVTEDDFTVFTEEKVDTLDKALQNFFDQINSGNKNNTRSYIAIQAFLNPNPRIDQILQQLQKKIQKTYRIATTIGYGPRFLHSTGQLHKGDGGQGLFFQITADSAEDVPIPEQAGEEKSSLSFGVLVFAQALGDRQALMDAGRTVIRVHVKKNIDQVISLITDRIQ